MSFVLRGQVKCDGYGPYYDRQDCDTTQDCDVKINYVRGGINFEPIDVAGWLQLSDGEIMCPGCREKMRLRK